MTHHLFHHVEQSGEPLLASGGEAPRDGFFVARGLRAQLGNFHLGPISFEIPTTSTLGVIGPSGCGKTLLLRALSGLAPLEDGAVFSGQARLDTLSPRERNVGLVFQDYALYPSRTGAGNISFPLEVVNASRATVDTEVLRIAAELGIEDEFLTRRVTALPEGIKQLIAIGRAENRPPLNPVRLFLMDEPLVHLDASVREKMRAFLKRLVMDAGVTTVYAFNDSADALALSDRLLVLREGELVQFGLAGDVYGRPVDREAMDLLSLNGSSALAGEYEEGVVHLVGGADIPASIPDAMPGDYRGPVQLCFRPEETEPVSATQSDGLGARVLRSFPYDGGRVMVEAAWDEGVSLRFLAPVGAAPDDVLRFRPYAAMAYPIA